MEYHLEDASSNLHNFLTNSNNVRESYSSAKILEWSYHEADLIRDASGIDFECRGIAICYEWLNLTTNGFPYCSAIKRSK